MGDAHTSTGLVTKYLADCRRRGLAKTTLWAKSHVLAKVDLEVGLFSAKPEDLAAWLDRTILASSKATYLATIRAFYEWCMDEGAMTSNPTRRVARPKVPTKEPAPISGEDLAKALDAANPRMRAWLLLGAAAGLRCCEIAMVARQDVHLEQPQWLHVTHGKGSKERNVPLHPFIGEALVELPQMGRMGRLFPTQNAASISSHINRHLHGLGIESSAHKLRHYAATEYWRALNEAGTPDVLSLMDFLGHSSPVTSLKYTRRDDRKAAAAMTHFSVPGG